MDYIHLYTNTVTKYNFYYFCMEEKAHKGSKACGPWTYNSPACLSCSTLRIILKRIPLDMKTLQYLIWQNLKKPLLCPALRPSNTKAKKAESCPKGAPSQGEQDLQTGVTLMSDKERAMTWEQRTDTLGLGRQLPEGRTPSMLIFVLLWPRFQEPTCPISDVL